ncbi:hypothetical protein [Xanthomonas hyacinthi]|uniref:hypothetical protein n=1 Tax=Xanthomonas hyacinthi TaxID=56455 RepID=UPI001B8014CD|nr:hypothetical protein [Xanthomonas hyacinthi]
MKNCAVRSLGSVVTVAGVPFSSVTRTCTSTCVSAVAGSELVMRISASKAWRSRVSSCLISILTRAHTDSCASDGATKPMKRQSTAMPALAYFSIPLTIPYTPVSRHLPQKFMPVCCSSYPRPATRYSASTSSGLGFALALPFT